MSFKKIQELVFVACRRENWLLPALYMSVTLSITSAALLSMSWSRARRRKEDCSCRRCSSPAISSQRQASIGGLHCNFKFFQGVLCKTLGIYCAILLIYTPFAKKKNWLLPAVYMSVTSPITSAALLWLRPAQRVQALHLVTRSC